MKNFVCIFAHPDDEAFGPSGTIAKLAKTNNVYIICATDGGFYKKKDKGIDTRRKKELQKSAKILGVKEVIFLGFDDGFLCNANYHKLVSSIKQHLDNLRPSEIMTFEQKGVSGHIDHIVVSMVSSYLFEHLKYIKKIYYYCMSKTSKEKLGDYFVYVPDGYKESEVDEVIDISEELTIKLKAIKAHKSQKQDIDKVLEITNGTKKELFLTKIR